MSEGRRTEILRDLEQIFLSEGFAHLTIDKIAGRLKCSKATLYAVASSREQLIVQAFERTFRARSATIRERVAHESVPSARIATYVEAVRDEFSAMTPECYADVRAFEGTDAPYRRAVYGTAHLLEQYIDEGVAAGEFKPGNSAFLGVVFNVLLDAVVSGQFRDRLNVTDADAFAEISALLLTSISEK